MPNTDDEGHVIENSFMGSSGACLRCGSTEREMRNYSMIWHDGDIYCVGCGEFIRHFDAG